jgi:hypothetical protein
MSAGALTTAAAARAAAAKARQEEEQMTPYSTTELAGDWEFKILRAATRKFRNPMVLHAILAQEARAGWTLVEKFDDMRVRLKRPASARDEDAVLDFDPYRTWVGISPGTFTILVVLATLAAFALLVSLIFGIMHSKGMQ